jgi:hypothetical protein
LAGYFANEFTVEKNQRFAVSVGLSVNTDDLDRSTRGVTGNPRDVHDDKIITESLLHLSLRFSRQPSRKIGFR